MFFYISGSRQIKALRVVWTPLLRQNFSRVGPQGYLGGPLGPPIGDGPMSTAPNTLSMDYQIILSCLDPTFEKNIFPHWAPGVLWGPPGAPLGVGTMSTSPDTLHMNQNIQNENIKLVSVQNWHRQNNLNMHQNR